MSKRLSVSVCLCKTLACSCTRTRAVGAASANQSVNASFELVEFDSLVSVLIEIVNQILRLLLCHYTPHGLHGLEIGREGRRGSNVPSKLDMSRSWRDVRIMHRLCTHTVWNPATSIGVILGVRRIDRGVGSTAGGMGDEVTAAEEDGAMVEGPD